MSNNLYMDLDKRKGTLFAHRSLFSEMLEFRIIALAESSVEYCV